MVVRNNSGTQFFQDMVGLFGMRYATCPKGMYMPEQLIVMFRLPALFRLASEKINTCMLYVTWHCNCCGRPAANFVVVNRLGQLLQKTSACCVDSQTGLLQEVLNVMVVAEGNEQVVW